MKFKAVRYHGHFDARLDILEMDDLANDQIRCKALRSVLSLGTETMMFNRVFDSLHRCPKDMFQNGPAMFGYSMAAEVIEVGKNVAGFTVGERVVADIQHRQFFDIEPSPVNVQKIPDWLEPEVACWTMPMRACYCANYAAGVGPKTTVVVLGQGIFGVGGVQFARIFGAKRIIAVDPRKVRAERAAKFGATHSLNAQGCDIIEKVKEINDDQLADVVIDATNTPESLSQACQLLRRGGHISLIADPPNPLQQHLGNNFLVSYLTIHCIYIRMQLLEPKGIASLTREKMDGEIFDHFHTGKLDTKGMMTDVVSPENCQELYRMLFEDCGGHLGIQYDWSLVKEAL
ncbi:hypothetical protein FACS1894187_04250 [Synergistales bacterium]|nr:hypothetical protein FACS1894187_04250 [Synergistales bacterium]